MDEWLAALQEPTEGYTDTEIANAMGYSIAHYRSLVKTKLLKAGIIRPVGFTRRGKTKAKTYELLMPNREDAQMFNVGLAVLHERPRRREPNPSPPQTKKKK